MSRLGSYDATYCCIFSTVGTIYGGEVGDSAPERDTSTTPGAVDVASVAVLSSINWSTVFALNTEPSGYVESPLFTILTTPGVFKEAYRTLSSPGLVACAPATYSASFCLMRTSPNAPACCSVPTVATPVLLAKLSPVYSCT